ncbi:MAG: hypothetical protein M1517_10335, partial [Deltaproteobacteria bacterium]|nr:hypothetical protein [Deltaproteobacteria bacterium]
IGKRDEYGKSNAGVGQSVPTRRVVIDARGTGLRPALFVKIKDQTGRDIYTARDVSMSRLQDRGMAEYVTSTATEQGDVVVRALSAAGPEHSDIVVSFADADRLTGADGALPGGNVVIIADPPTE